MRWTELGWRYVPKELEPNLRFRLLLYRRAREDVRFRRAVWKLCMEDVLFFFAAFCWVHEPRLLRDKYGRVLPQHQPFIPWPHQINVIKALRENLGFCDIGIEKSRDEGATWIICTLALHDWLFFPGTKIGMASWSEEMADDPGNLDSLMTKVTWQLGRLPVWMAGRKGVDWDRNVHSRVLVNYRNDSHIKAFSATVRAGRGGRYKWFFCDEMAAWQEPRDMEFLESVRGSTNSRVVVSTPSGMGGAFASFMLNEGNVLKLRLSWRDNPRKKVGMYRLIDGRPVAIDPVGNPLTWEYENFVDEVRERLERLQQRGFDFERVRSPWYDEQCDRPGATPLSVAKELDIDYSGSEPLAFGEEVINKVVGCVRPPQWRASFRLREGGGGEIFEAPGGQVLLWEVYPRSLSRGAFVAGVDVAAGTGGSTSSNSVLVIVSVDSGVQVLEWATNVIDPTHFAECVVEICRLYNDAYLIWEANGAPGVEFTRQVLVAGYRNIYMRKSLMKRGRERRRMPGWMTTGGMTGTRAIMLSGLRTALATGRVVVRSAALASELRNYVWVRGQMVSRYMAIRGEDGSAVGEAHGDRVVAMAMAVQGMLDRYAQYGRRSEAVRVEQVNERVAEYLREYDRSRLRQDAWTDLFCRSHV